METATISPLERGARALAKAQSGVDDYDALDEAFQATLKENVAAVLMALREPDRDSRLRAWGSPSSRTELWAWQAMIDAALSE